MKTGILILTVALMSACGSNPSNSSADAKTAQTDDPSKGIICTYTKPVDSFIKEKKCTTPEQRQAERDQRDTAMDVRNARDSGL